MRLVILVLMQDDGNECDLEMSLAILVLFPERRVGDLWVIGNHLFVGRVPETSLSRGARLRGTNCMG